MLGRGRRAAGFIAGLQHEPGIPDDVVPQPVARRHYHEGEINLVGRTAHHADLTSPGLLPHPPNGGSIQDFGRFNRPPRIGSGTPVVLGRLSGKPRNERMAR